MTNNTLFVCIYTSEDIQSLLTKKNLQINLKILRLTYTYYKFFRQFIPTKFIYKIDSSVLSE